LEAAVFIRREQPAAARRLYDNVSKKTNMLRHHPLLGRVVPEFQNRFLRELVFPPYRVIYRVLAAESRIDVLAAVHSSRLLPTS
jgi:toxin ParE1/3/4